MKKLSLPLMLLLATCAAQPVAAQTGRVPLFPDRNGFLQGATPTVCIASDEVRCPAGTAADPLFTSPSTAASGTGAQQVQGNVASGATDAGNPVKLGCVAKLGLVTAVSSGQRVDCAADQYGNNHAWLVAPFAAGSDTMSSAFTGFVNNPANGSVNGYPLGVATQVYDPATGNLPRQRGDTIGTWVVGKGGANILTGQVAVGTSATLIAASRPARQKIAVTVTSAVQCAFGPAGVTLATGWPLAAVAYVSDNWDTAAALYGVCASAATTVGYREQF